jgi:hypothetical protein
MKIEANTRPDSFSPYQRLVRWIGEVDDGNILRVAFFALLAGTASVLFVDYRELTAGEGTALAMPIQPILPPFDPEGPGTSAHPAITTSPETLQQPLEIALGSGGQLHLTGSITIGSAALFAAEIEARGEYVQTVILDSPGGSVSDALAIGSLIHEKGLATKVAAGSLCASSCPIILASGATRLASPDAAIGVHQVYAAALSADPQQTMRMAGVAMRDAQSTTAEIISHLTTTGVDPALWLHALETPPDQLYYFTAEEMTRLRLVTELTDS